MLKGVPLTPDWTLTKDGDWLNFDDNGTVQNRMHRALYELTLLARIDLSYDAKGNLTQDQQSHSYVWDFENQLQSISVGTDMHRYTYDVRGRRVSKTVQSGMSNASTEQVNHL